VIKTRTSREPGPAFMRRILADVLMISLGCPASM
jgi:hypothetical protein